MTARVADMANFPDWPGAMSKEQAAAYCNLSPPSFTQAVARGELPEAIRFGARVVWVRSALDMYLDRASGLAGRRTVDIVRERIRARAS